MLFKFINGLLTPKVDVSRRHFLMGAGASIIATPAIVKISSIDRVRGIILPQEMPSAELNTIWLEESARVPLDLQDHYGTYAEKWFMRVDPYSHTAEIVRAAVSPNELFLAAHEKYENMLNELSSRMVKELDRRSYRIPLQRFGIERSLVPQKRVGINQISHHQVRDEKGLLTSNITVWPPVGGVGRHPDQPGIADLSAAWQFDYDIQDARDATQQALLEKKEGEL